MLLSNITGVKKVTTLSALTDVRSTSKILSSNDYFLASILSGEGYIGNFPSGYASVKVNFDTVVGSIFGFDPVGETFTLPTAGTFTAKDYAKISVGSQTRYIRLYELS